MQHISTRPSFKLPRLGLSVLCFSPNDNAGVIYISDGDNAVIRQLETKGNVTTVAGNGQFVTADGIGGAASLNTPTGITLLNDTTLFVTDVVDHMVRQIALAQ